MLLPLFFHVCIQVKTINDAHREKTPPWCSGHQAGFCIEKSHLLSYPPQPCPHSSVHFVAWSPMEVIKLYLLFVAPATPILRKADTEQDRTKGVLAALARDERDISQETLRLDSAPALGQGRLRSLQCPQPNSASHPPVPGTPSSCTSGCHRWPGQ